MFLWRYGVDIDGPILFANTRLLLRFLDPPPPSNPIDPTAHQTTIYTYTYIVSTQRRQYKIYSSGTGESTPMTAERVQRLEEIEFSWSAKRPRHVQWESRFHALLDFKAKYGHVQVRLCVGADCIASGIAT